MDADTPATPALVPPIASGAVSPVTAPLAPIAAPPGAAVDSDGDAARCKCGCGQVWSNRYHMWLCVHCDNIVELHRRHLANIREEAP